jgi:FAD dependent oxidoreductase
MKLLDFAIPQEHAVRRPIEAASRTRRFSQPWSRDGQWNRVRQGGLFCAHIWLLSCALMVSAAAAQTHSSPSAEPDFDVVIVGGSTAALAAAFSAADLGARTALIEPTDWIGGQLTSSGVPAIDECWHKVHDSASGKELFSAAALARDPRNMTPSFRDMFLRIGNPGRGWVSRFCFEPSQLLASELLPQLDRRAEHLKVFYQSVPKSVEVDRATRRITSLTIVRRVSKSHVSWNGYDILPSLDVADWYSPQESARYRKSTIRIEGNSKTVFLDASEWGELLVLADAPYLQGVELSEGGREANEQAGQCITFGFVQALLDSPAEEEAMPKDISQLGWGQYRDKSDAWNQVWTYRRIRGSAAEPRAGDLSLQNWGYSPALKEGGNDYPFRYLFLPRAETAAQRSNWRGGIDLTTLSGAEQRALAWHGWFKQQAPKGIDPGQIQLARGPLGTGHGLSKLPYIRDTRRSIGIDGFILRVADLTGDPAKVTAPSMVDRVAIGCYDADIHAMADVEYPSYIREARVILPFHIPFRALTNDAFDNLLVAGKTMAQSFLANSATRLHPIEWSTGIAAGSAAAQMAKTGRSSRDILVTIDQLQAIIAPQTPIDWTIDSHGDPGNPQ